MIYKPYGKTGKMVSAIGFGGMRFLDDCTIEEGAEIVRYASSKGINYFDTAPFYCNDRSEDIFGEAFKAMPNPFYVSTKSGIGNEPDADAVRRRIENSLKRLGVDKINFHHMWCVMDLEQYRNVIKKGGPYWGALKAKEEGLIDHVVISTHANGSEIRTIAEEGYFEGVTLGYNVVNFPYRGEGIEAAHKAGMGVVTMNPLGGGLIPQHQDYFSFIKENDAQTTMQAALRFNAAHEEISVVLAGISSKAQVDENVAAVENLTILQKDQVNQLKLKLKSDLNELCTTCQYCKHCPKGIDIPKFMELHNQFTLKGIEGIQAKYKDMLQYKEIQPTQQAMPKECIACKKCEKLCTQKLPIIERLKWLDENIVK